MNFEFKLPDIGEGLVEGEIVKWFVKEGDSVQEHQPLAAVLTDKAEVEIPSPKAGRILKLYGKPGEKVKVHAPLVLFDVAGGGSTPPVSAPAPQKNEDSDFVFLLPDLGEGLTEGELVKWHVKEGQSVREHQPIAAVLTDKAEVEIPSPKTGAIATLHAKPGEKVRVHAPLVTFRVSGAPASGARAAAPTAAPQRAPAPTPARRAGASRQTDVLAAPMVRKLAKDAGVDITAIIGSGPQGRVLEADVRGYAVGSIVPAAGTTNATAAVKALAASLGVDLARLHGTGPGGRVCEGDVRAAAPASAPARIATAAAPTAAPVSIARQPGDESVPFTGIRRKIAEKMTQSQRAVAQVTHMDECDMSAVLTLRESLKAEAAKRGTKLTFLPFIVRALVKSLQEFPMFNSSLDEAAGEIVVKRRYNIGVAVAAPQGLLVPNLKNADGKDLWGLAAEIAALAEKVRANTIDVASLQGGTFTITNIGPIGGLFATPIVNHPEVAILGLMKLQKRPVVRDEKVVVRDMMNLVLSFDHRIVDGADAANFMNTLIRHLENPRTLL